MEKYLSCYNLTEKCYFVSKDESELRTLEKMTEHIERIHNIKMTEEMKERALELMQEAA